MLGCCRRLTPRASPARGCRLELAEGYSTRMRLARSRRWRRRVWRLPAPPPPGRPKGVNGQREAYAGTLLTSGGVRQQRVADSVLPVTYAEFNAETGSNDGI